MSVPGEIIRKICAEYRNSDLRADNRDIRDALDAKFAELTERAERAEKELEDIEVLLNNTVTNYQGLVNTLRAERDELKARVDRLAEPYVDERQESWMAPTAWAYAQTCKALRKAEEQNDALAAQVEELRRRIQELASETLNQSVKLLLEMILTDVPASEALANLKRRERLLGAVEKLRELQAEWLDASDGVLVVASDDLGDKADQLERGSRIPMSMALEQLIECARDHYRQNPPTEAQKREHAISFVLGNLNTSTNHQTTREVIEREYDRLYGKKDAIREMARPDVEAGTYLDD